MGTPAPHPHHGRPPCLSRRVRTPWVRACEASRVPTCLAIAGHWLAPNRDTASWYRRRSLGFHTPTLGDWSALAPQLHAPGPLRGVVNAAAASTASPGNSAAGVSSDSAGLSGAELGPGSDGWAPSAHSRPPPTPEQSIPSPIRRCRLSTARAVEAPGTIVVVGDRTANSIGLSIRAGWVCV